jgi:hypothetical protein
MMGIARGLPEGSPIVAVICGNLNPPHAHGSCLAGEQRGSGFVRGLPAAKFAARPCAASSQVWTQGTFHPPGEPPMFEVRDLFQWDRFITPTIIKTFYWLVIALIVLFGISGIFNGLAAMAISPFGGFIVLLSSIAGVVVGIVFSRIAAEFILIVFRINEHLGAIRDQGAGH